MENNTNLNEECCTKSNKKCCLCSPQMIFNMIAALLIIVLLIMQFFNPFKKSNSIVTHENGLNVAFVESDSIMTQLEMVEDMKTNLNNLSDSLDKELKQKQQSFQAKVNSLQEGVQSGKIQTKEEYSRRESALAAEQEQLMNLRDSYLAQVQIMQMGMNKAILDSMVSVIKKYPIEFPYDYILDHNNGSGVLYANEKLNITKSIIKKLNKEYKK